MMVLKFACVSLYSLIPETYGIYMEEDMVKLMT